MHGQAVKNEHITGVNLTPNPLVPHGCLDRDLWDMKIFVLMFLEAKMVRTLQYLQGTHIDWAVMKGNPDGITFRIAIHETIVLMRMDSQAFAIRKDQTANGFGMDQKMLSHDHLHHALQGRIMRQSVK